MTARAASGEAIPTGRLGSHTGGEPRSWRGSASGGIACGIGNFATGGGEGLHEVLDGLIGETHFDEELVVGPGFEGDVGEQRGGETFHHDHLGGGDVLAGAFGQGDDSCRVDTPVTEDFLLFELCGFAGLKEFGEVFEVDLIDQLVHFLIFEEGDGAGMVEDISEGPLALEEGEELGIGGDFLDILALGEGKELRIASHATPDERVVVDQADEIGGLVEFGWGAIEEGDGAVEATFFEFVAGLVEAFDPGGVVIAGGDLDREVAADVDEKAKGDGVDSGSDEADEDAEASVHAPPSTEVDIIAFVFEVQFDEAMNVKTEADEDEVDEGEGDERGDKLFGDGMCDFEAWQELSGDGGERGCEVESEDEPHKRDQHANRAFGKADRAEGNK